MKAHLSEDQIRNYHSRKMSASELLQIDEHMEHCPDCSARLIQNSTMETKVSSLDLQLQSEEDEDHLEYEQLVGYLEHTLDPSNREIVQAHLQTCPSCTAEEQDLRRFGKVIAARNKKSTVVFRIAGIAAAIALLAISVSIVQFNKPATDPVAFVIHDGQYQIAFNKEDQVLSSEWNLPENKQQQLQQALEGKAIQIPHSITELRSKKRVLLSEDVPDAKVRVTQPLGTVIITDRPTFHWEGPTETDGYSISIYDTHFDQVAESPVIDQKEWTIESPLERGKTYIWMVSMRQDDRILKAPIPPAPEARFRVLSSGDYETLKTRIQQSQGSHLLLGLHYLEFGLLDDVEREWRQLVKQNPDSTKVQSLIHSLEILRQP